MKKLFQFLIPALFMLLAVVEGETGGAAAAPAAPAGPTPEELALKAAAAAQAKADKAAAAAKAKADKAAAKAAEKQAKADKAAADKQAKADAKAAGAAAKEKEKADKIAAKEQAKADREAAKTANQMPEQNGVRRPKPDTLCGRAWAVFNAESQKLGQPVSISASLAVTNPMGLNEGNVKAEYARWRKFFGITGRIAPPQAAAAATEATQTAAAQ